MQVLHVVANRWWTGSADPALDLAVRLRGRGQDVWFACIRGDILERKVRAAGFEPVRGLSLERTARPWVLVREVAGLRRALRSLRVEIVHAHQSHDHWLAALARRGTGARLVRTVHHRRALHGGGLTRWLFGRTDLVIAPSEAIAARAGLIGVGAGRIAVVPGAVDLARFSPRVDGRAVRAELGLGEAPVAGTVARMVPARGYEALLDAVRLLRRQVPAVRAVLVGRGEHRPVLETLVERLGLRETVVFAGYRGEDLPAVLAALDCFVLLGAGSEESCRAALEAMAAGRPVVAARVGALPETVVDGETGWLVGPSPEDVSARLEAVLVDRDVARRMGAAGRRRVEARHSPEVLAAAVERLYRQVLDSRGSASK